MSTIVRNSPLAPDDAVYFDHIEYDPDAIPERFGYTATVTQPNIHDPDQPLTIEVTIRNQHEAEAHRIDMREFGLYAAHRDHEFQWFEVDDAHEHHAKTFDADARVWRSELNGQPLIRMTVATLEPGETATVRLGLYFRGDAVPTSLPERMWFQHIQPVIHEGVRQRFQLAR